MCFSHFLKFKLTIQSKQKRDQESMQLNLKSQHRKAKIKRQAIITFFHNSFGTNSVEIHTFTNLDDIAHLPNVDGLNS